MAQRRLPVLVAGGYDWVDVRDVVEGAIRAEEKAPSGTKYLLSGHWVSVRDIAAMIAQISGISTRNIVLPRWVARLGAPVIGAVSRLKGKRPLYTSVSLRTLKSNRHISHEKATRELDYHPRPLYETLVDTLRWFEENGQLDLSAEARNRESP